MLAATPPSAHAQRTQDAPRESEVAVFQAAMDAYKQESGRMFPTWSEVLEVLRALGYEKPGPASV